MNNSELLRSLAAEAKAISGTEKKGKTKQISEFNISLIEYPDFIILSSRVFLSLRQTLGYIRNPKVPKIQAFFGIFC